MRISRRWIAVTADGTAATLYAVDGAPPSATLAGQLDLAYTAEALAAQRGLPACNAFIREHGLAGCTAIVQLTGGGTIVHKLRMPPMGARQREQAVRTRLRSYGGGLSLCTDQRRLHVPNDDATHVLAAGADATLVRGLHAMLRKAGLRVQAITVPAAAFAAPAADGRAVQVFLGERTATVQVFENGVLTACRDLLVGRANFVAAYQRPILTDNGPITLDAAQADELLRTVGIPLQPDTPCPHGISASQLWPLVTPTVQRLSEDLRQSLGAAPTGATEVDVLGLPPVPGLAEHLAAELHFETPESTDEQREQRTLAALRLDTSAAAPLDLLPAEERFVKRLYRPALAAGVCALLVILANMQAPREAQASSARLHPATASLSSQMRRLRNDLRQTFAARDRMAAALERDAVLLAGLPPQVDALRACKVLFDSVPTGVVLTSVQVGASNTPAAIELQAIYRGTQPAGVVAGEWARWLGRTPPFLQAEVVTIACSAEEPVAAISIRALAQ